MEELLTTKEVAQRLKVKHRTVLKWLNEGRLKGGKIGPEWRIKASDLEDFITRAFDEKESASGKP